MSDQAAADTTMPTPSKGLLDRLESVYKDLHAHPELSMQETRTAALAATHLTAHGFDVTNGVGGTGVVGARVPGVAGDACGLATGLAGGLTSAAAGSVASGRSSTGVNWMMGAFASSSPPPAKIKARPSIATESSAVAPRNLVLSSSMM